MTDPTVTDLGPQSALDHNQLALDDGVLATPGSDDCRIVVDSGALGATDTLAVGTAGRIRSSGTVADIPLQPVGVPAADPDDPRKDLVVGKADGSVTVIEGTPEVAQYSRLLDDSERVLRNAYRPTPADATAVDGVPLAVVLVLPDAQTVSGVGGPDGDVRDRRSFVLVERFDAAESHLGRMAAGDGDLTFEDGILTHWNGHESIHGERSANEVERWVGDTSDYVYEYGGTGYLHHLYNAYNDGSDMRYLVSGECAVDFDLRGDVGDVQVKTAPAGLSGEVIDWQSATIKGGSIDEADHAAQADSATRADTADALDGRGAAGYATRLPRSRIVYQDVNGDGTDHLIRVNNATEFLTGGGVGSGQATFEIMASHIRNYSGGAGDLSKIRADMLVQRAGSDWYERTDYLYQTGCSRSYENFNAGDIRFAYSTPTYRATPNITIRQIG